MTLTPGVPSLDAALRAARRAGATVETVSRTGEVRVTPPEGGASLRINNRRKDATRELVALVDRLEAQARNGTPPPRPAPADLAVAVPPPAATDGPAPVAPVASIADRIRAYLRSATTPDAGGWRPYDKHAIGEAIGVDPARVSVWAAQAQPATVRRDLRIEVRKEAGGRGVITHLRFATDAPAAEAEAPAVDYRDQPLRALDPVPPAPLGMPDLPHLAAYALAAKLSKQHPLLDVRLSEDQIGEVLREAARLYWWVRAG